MIGNDGFKEADEVRYLFIRFDIGDDFIEEFDHRFSVAATLSSSDIGELWTKQLELNLRLTRPHFLEDIPQLMRFNIPSNTPDICLEIVQNDT